MSDIKAVVRRAARPGRQRVGPGGLRGHPARVARGGRGQGDGGGAAAPRCVLDNTANLAALGELKCGALQGVSARGVHQGRRYGVGAGLILGGELFRGSAGTAGEIGHLTIDENGPVCRCGNRGCLETFIGAHALRDALATSHGAAGPARHHRPGPRRRPRLPPGARGRGASPRRGGRRPGQPASTPRSSSWAASSPRSDAIITEPDARRPRAVRHPQRGRVRDAAPTGELDADADVVGALAVAEARQAAAEGSDRSA